MLITYYGLNCFRIQTNGGSVLLDPFEKSAGVQLPRMQNDMILLSHQAVTDKARDKFVIAGPGEYEIKDIFVYGLPASGDQDNGTFFLIKAEGISLVHLGLIKQFKLTAGQKEILEDADVLMIPVGGGESLSAKQAAAVVNELEPRIVIPMYYSLPEFKVKLDGVDKFKKEMVAKSVVVDKLKLQKKDLPQEETNIYIIERSQ